MLKPIDREGFDSDDVWNFSQSICTLVSPLLKGAELTLSVAKTVRIPLFETVPVLYFLLLSNGVTGFGSTETNDRVSGCTVLLLIEKKNQINIPKTIGNRKKMCVRLRSEDKHKLRKSAGRKEQIRKAFFPLTGLMCAFRSADFLRWCLSSERNVTHNLLGAERHRQREREKRG